jgi:hypothetical protein
MISKEQDSIMIMINQFNRHIRARHALTSGWGSLCMLWWCGMSSDREPHGCHMVVSDSSRWSPKELWKTITFNPKLGYG